MQYRVLNLETNTFFPNEGLSLSPNGTLLFHNEPIPVKYEIQPSIYIADREKRTIFAGDAIVIKKERLRRGDTIWLRRLEKHTENHDIDEVIFQIMQSENYSLYYDIFFKKNGTFLTNKDMFPKEELQHFEVNAPRALPFDDFYILRDYAKENNLEIIYNITDTDKWIFPF